MGLDMYLEKRHYVRNWDHTKPEERHIVTVSKGGVPVAHIKPERISDVTELVAYWRKANAIHQWFVTNVQGGEDDCGDYPVQREELQALLDLVRQVLAKPSLAVKLLPTQSGFFFGGTDYDEDYVTDLRDTENMLVPLLADSAPDDYGEFYYRASW